MAGTARSRRVLVPGCAPIIDDVEHELVGRAVAGDAEAFGGLLTHHRRSALRIATVVLGTTTGAEDVVQDADLRAWRARRTLDPQRSFRPWYLAVVANTARTGRRGRVRRAALELRVAREPAQVEAPDPVGGLVSAAEREAVVAALNRLRRDDRLVIALRYFEQLGESEMAEVLECPPGTVKSRLSRAMQRLRQQMGPTEMDREK